MYAVQLAKSEVEGGWVPRLGGKFQPNLVNTVVFLVSSVQVLLSFSHGLHVIICLLTLSFLPIHSLALAPRSYPLIHPGPCVHTCRTYVSRL